MYINFWFFLLSILLFGIGLGGIILNKKNLILILMSIELILLSANINLISFSVYLDDIVGQVFSFFVLTVAAAESSIGLALLVIYYRLEKTIEVEKIHMLKG